MISSQNATLHMWNECDHFVLVIQIPRPVVGKPLWNLGQDQFHSGSWIPKFTQCLKHRGTFQWRLQAVTAGNCIFLGSSSSRGRLHTNGLQEATCKSETDQRDSRCAPGSMGDTIRTCLYVEAKVLCDFMGGAVLGYWILRLILLVSRGWDLA